MREFIIFKYYTGKKISSYIKVNLMSQFLHVRTMNKSIFYNIAEKA